MSGPTFRGVPVPPEALAMFEGPWVLTSREVYRVVYQAHHEALSCHASHTCDGVGCPWHTESCAMTEWGFRNAERPLIKSEREGEVWRYWIYKG